jgi:hypothetical protein
MENLEIYTIEEHTNEVDLILNRLREHSKIATSDIIELGKYIWMPLPSLFKSKLDERESITVKSVEFANLYDFLNMSIKIFESNNPMAQFIYEQSVINEFNNAIMNNPDKDNELLTKIKIYELVIKYVFSRGNLNLKAKIVGTVPMKGIFSMRQEKADHWFDGYITWTLFVTRQIQLISNFDISLASRYMFINVANYILYSYPSEFSVQENETQEKNTINVLHQYLKIVEFLKGNSQSDHDISLLKKMELIFK